MKIKRINFLILNCFLVLSLFSIAIYASENGDSDNFVYEIPTTAVDEKIEKEKRTIDFRNESKKENTDIC